MNNRNTNCDKCNIKLKGVGAYPLKYLDKTYWVCGSCMQEIVKVGAYKTKSGARVSSHRRRKPRKRSLSTFESDMKKAYNKFNRYF